jgi:hypothetical protein
MRGGLYGRQNWSEYQNARGQFSGATIVVARLSQLGVPGSASTSSLLVPTI